MRPSGRPGWLWFPGLSRISHCVGRVCFRGWQWAVPPAHGCGWLSLRADAGPGPPRPCPWRTCPGPVPLYWWLPCWAALPCPFPLGVAGWPWPSPCQPLPSARVPSGPQLPPWRSQILPVSAPSLINVRPGISNKGRILRRPPQPHTSHCSGPIQMARKQPMQYMKEMRQK